MRRLDFFNESKIVAAQASLSPSGKEEVGHFPANHIDQSRNERFGGNGPLGPVRYAHVRGVRNKEIEEMQLKCTVIFFIHEAGNKSSGRLAMLSVSLRN
jgi:hypothetical protein